MSSTRASNYLIKALINLGADPDSISREATLSSLGINSLLTIELLLDIEASAGITIPDDELYSSNLDTVDSFLSLLARLGL